MGVFQSIGASLGLLTSYLGGYFLHWQTMVLLYLSVPSLALVGMLTLPETPHWLIDQGREEEARYVHMD